MTLAHAALLTCLFVPVAAMAGVPSLLAPTTSPAAATPGTVIVMVNGTPILERQVIEEADRRINANIARTAQAGLTYEESSRDETRRAMRDDVLHTLIERALVARQLRIDGIQISEEEIDAQFAARARKFNQTLEEAQREIVEQGKTVADVRERLRWHTVAVRKLYDRHALRRPPMSDEAARQMYDQDPSLYAQQHERRVSRILFYAAPDDDAAIVNAARAKAEAARERIRRGEAFATVAREMSEDAGTRRRGGDRGWSPRGFVTAPGNDPFGDVAFAMTAIGEISDVVRTLDGFEIIMLTGLRPAHQRSFEEAKAEILEKDEHWEIGNFWESYAGRLRAQAHIEWNPAEKARRDKAAEEAKALEREMAAGATTQPAAGQ